MGNQLLPLKKQMVWGKGTPFPHNCFWLAWWLDCNFKSRCQGRKKLAPLSARNGCEVSHILFTDDVLTFAKANKKNTVAIKDVFRKFAGISDLEINPTKSQVMIGRSTTIAEIQSALMVEAVELPGKYLDYLCSLVDWQGTCVSP